MSTTDKTLMIRQLVETAVASMIETAKTSGHPLAACSIRTAHDRTAKPWPRVVVEVTAAPVDDNVSDLYMLTTAVYVGTRITEAANSSDLHRARVGRIEELLWAGEGNALKTATSGSSDLLVHAVYPDDSVGEPDGEHWADAVTSIIACQLKGSP
jgi:hypothetical protein